MTTSKPVISASQRRALLVDRQLSAMPSTQNSTPKIVDIVDSLLALHSSDPATVYLSLLVRSPATTIAAIESELYGNRSLVRVHGMRRTLWVGTRSVARDILAASSTRLHSQDRRRIGKALEKAGVVDNADQWLADAEEELLAYISNNSPTDTRSVGSALPHLTVGFDGAPGKAYSATIAAHSRVLLLLGFKGLIVRADPLGSWIGSQYRWYETERWLNESLVAADDPDAAATELVGQQAMIGRYLDRFAPATETDIRWWSGWPAGVVRRALDGLGAVSVDLEGCPECGWVRDAAAFAALLAEVESGSGTSMPSVAVLPGLDPTTMGWKQRQWYLDEAMISTLFDRNGNGGPTIWVDGQIVGGWAQRDDGEMVYEMLTDVGRPETEMVETKLGQLSSSLADAADGSQRYKLRFPNPLNTKLRR